MDFEGGEHDVAPEPFNYQKRVCAYFDVLLKKHSSREEDYDVLMYAKRAFLDLFFSGSYEIRLYRQSTDLVEMFKYTNSEQIEMPLEEIKKKKEQVWTIVTDDQKIILKHRQLTQQAKQLFEEEKSGRQLFFVGKCVAGISLFSVLSFFAYRFYQKNKMKSEI